MSVKLYVEGGGDHNKALQTRCRKGFSEFLRKSGLEGYMPRIVACGSRGQAFDDFRAAHGQGQATTVFLLVDSEDPVRAANPWDHVENRSGDKWRRPSGVAEDQLHFMVQTMEAWFYADREGLMAFYGRHFRPESLSKRLNIEEIPKADLFSGLRQATANCQKGEYSKGEHSFLILERIDPAKVRTASPWCARFLESLLQVCHR